eukprot:TRINITY_DN7435_c0_g1_i1.p4 TRINITY_DN7435_c0_g1~~TRINITY_DN7435_c0_g1_i1.p4  ORF type:complete len:100 (-),score=7.61 TRINITY_DN7435_c0_g1_i1:22-321(-)
MQGCFCRYRCEQLVVYWWNDMHVNSFIFSFRVVRIDVFVDIACEQLVYCFFFLGLEQWGFCSSKIWFQLVLEGIDRLFVNLVGLQLIQHECKDEINIKL